jgi:tetratricopeptide (TPR) repeat protein
LLELALQAQRSGTLSELVRKHPHASRWMMRRYLHTFRGAAGSACRGEPLEQLAPILLAWLIARQRPDGEVSFDGLAQDQWLDKAGWRPMLAMASHAGILEVPAFPGRYHRRPGEAALDNLCGLWNVGPSTIYRLLEKSRQAMAQELLEPLADAPRRLAFRGWVVQSVRSAEEADGPERRAWHQRQAEELRNANEPAAALWHSWQGRDVAGLLDTLRKHAALLAAEVETDALLERVVTLDLVRRARVDLWLARASLARTRDQAGRELEAYEEARRVAQAAGDSLLLGLVHSALGRYYEPRDSNRAFACYQDSADFLRDVGLARDDPRALEHVATTYARLAWLYLLRNDPRSKAVLDRAEELRARFRLPDDALGLLENVWGQYWRRAGDIARSLEHRYRALNIFERLGDQRSVHAAYINIGYDLAEQGKHAEAIELASRILAASRRGEVEPGVVVSAHLNIGAALFWKGDLAGAIDAYRTALERSTQGNLRLHATRARYNLAEAYYKRCLAGSDSEDERLADDLVATIEATPISESSPAIAESARSLKRKVLGQEPESDGASGPTRLLPGDSATHPVEFGKILRHRQTLAVPGDPGLHAQAHLAIAHAYAAIAAKEREAARVLVEREGLQDRFASEFVELRQTFERELTREDQLAAQWKQAAGELLDDTRRAAVVAHLLREGAINKSSYVELAAVAPATASKHLMTLAERGLVVQRGRGPSTRYELA